MCWSSSPISKIHNKSFVQNGNWITWCNMTFTELNWTELSSVPSAHQIQWRQTWLHRIGLNRITSQQNRLHSQWNGSKIHSNWNRIFGVDIYSKSKRLADYTHLMCVLQCVCAKNRENRFVGNASYHSLIPINYYYSHVISYGVNFLCADCRFVGGHTGWPNW